MNNHTPQSAARDFSANMIAQGYQPAGLHTYCDAESNPIFWRIRLKQPVTGDKIIWPMHKDDNGEYILKEPPSFADQKKPIYRQQDIVSHPDEVVYIHEGELCADVFSKLGFISTTSGGWNSAIHADWSLLKDRTVIIWPDADENGAKYAVTVAQILLTLNCTVWIVDVAKLNLPPKGDCVEWLAGKHQSTEDDIKLIKEAVFWLPLVEASACQNDTGSQKASASKDSADEDKNADFNKTTMLLELMEDVEFFHDERKRAYASFENNGHVETWPIDSHQFKDWLAHQFWREKKKSVHDAALRDALAVMKGRALFEGQCHEVFMRAGFLNGKYYINLADEQWQVG
jgi:DNA primase